MGLLDDISDWISRKVAQRKLRAAGMPRTERVKQVAEAYHAPGDNTATEGFLVLTNQSLYWSQSGAAHALRLPLSDLERAERMDGGRILVLYVIGSEAKYTFKDRIDGDRTFDEIVQAINDMG